MALARKVEIRAMNDREEPVVTTLSPVNPNVEAKTLDTAIKGLNRLTRNTYIDSYVIDTQSLNELASD